jgi:hypothetical protein
MVSLEEAFQFFKFVGQKNAVDQAVLKAAVFILMILSVVRCVRGSAERAH